jgi:alpha-glucosidase (family GH31 glycosyl hydrolase)
MRAPCLAIHALLGCAAVLSTACSSEPAEPANILAQLPEPWLEIQPKSTGWQLRRGAEVVLSAAAVDTIGFRQGNATIQGQFGSFLFTEGPQPPWSSVQRWQTVSALPDAATLEGIAADGQPMARLEVARTTSGTGLHLRVTPKTTWNRATWAWRLAPGEHLVGLGGQSFDVDHRGHRAELWVEEDGIGKFPDEAPPQSWFLNGKRYQTHTPMPVLVSSRGYAVVVRSDARVVVDAGKSQPDTLRWEVWEGALDLTVLIDSDLLSLRRALGRELGLPAVLPGFALMPWIDAIYGSANVRRVAQKMRDGGYPVSVVWSEDWRGGKKAGDDYTLDEDWLADDELYPDLPKLSADLHGMGYKFLTYNNTFLTSDGEVFAEAKQKGYGIRKADGSMYTFTGAKFVPASLLDLWNPAAWQWGQAHYATGLQAGVDGWMADFCEWLPVDAVMADGSSGLARHQRYPVECQRLNRELFDQWQAKDGVERLFFVRSAWLGSPSLVSVVWAGDQQTDFSEGDGLPSVIPMGIGLGMTGYPYYGSDIAGYASFGTEPTDKELFFRWVTLGALSPIMRTHHGKLAQANWQWEHDADTEAHFLHWTRFHAALWPYLWQLALEPELPMLRPLALHYPTFEPGWTRKDQYLLGDRLLVAPVVEQGKTSRTVDLPPGSWWPLAGGPAVNGGVALPVEASLTQIPVFVPSGTLLTMLADDGLRTFSEALTQQPAIQAIAQAPVGLELRVWPGANAGGLGEHHSTLADLVWRPNGWTGACTTAIWNGKSVQVQGRAVQVQGSGKLELDGVGVLTVSNSPQTQKGVRVVCPKP